MDLIPIKAQGPKMDSSEYLPAQEPVYEKHHDIPIEELFTANCVNFMAFMPIGCVDLVVTSPPHDNRA
jgi:hypothetical protein